MPTSPKLSRIATALFALPGTLLLFAVAGCEPREEEVAYHRSTELADSLESVADTPERSSIERFDCPAPPSFFSSPGIHLVLDGSQSMAGFSGQPGQVTAFDNILDRISVDWGVAELRVFGEGEPRGLFESRAINRSVHEPHLFTRSHNPDYCLIQALDSLDDGAVVAYLTDGVQSAASFGNPSPTVRKLKEWLARAHALEIVAFKSEFSGRAWSEQAGQWVGRADVSDRPFYLFVLAKRQPDLDQAMARVSPTLLATAERFRFPPTPLSCTVRVEAHTTFPAPTGVPYAFVGTQVRDQFFSAFPDTVALYACQVAPAYPIASITVQPTVEYYRWNPGSEEFTRDQPPAGADIRSDLSLAGGVGAAVTALLPSISAGAPSRFGLYRVMLSPRPATLPGKVAALSTETDTSVSEFRKTYRFDWLIEHLVRAHFQSTTRPASLYLVVQQDPT